MTPEEQGNKIRLAMYTVIPAHPDGSKEEWSAANRCAIICVEHLINEANDYNIHTGRNGLSDKEYWQQVLEILKQK